MPVTDLIDGPSVISQVYGCVDYSGEWAYAGCASGYFHAGVDVGFTDGGWAHFRTPVKAARDGTVVAIGIIYLGDSAVCIQEADGTFTEYGHLDQALVSVGQAVHGGDQIGLMGTKGSSSAPHLHVERRTDGPDQGIFNLLDPMDHLWVVSSVEPEPPPPPPSTVEPLEDHHHFAAPAPAPEPTPEPTPPPARARVLYGEFNPSFDPQGGSFDVAVLEARDADMGHKLDVVHWYIEQESFASQEAALRAVVAQARIPMLSWALPIDFFDTAYLSAWRAGLEALGGEVWVRFFWEFNDPECKSNGDFHVWPSCGHTPAKLVNSWAALRSQVRAENVRLIWNPDGTMGSQMYGDQNGSVGLAYPGDGNVDYRGFDAYDYNVLEQYHAENLQTGSEVPMVLGEIGSTDANWVGELGAALNDGRLSQVSAVLWFNESEWGMAGTVKSAVKGLLQTAAFQG